MTRVARVKVVKDGRVILESLAGAMPCFRCRRNDGVTTLVTTTADSVITFDEYENSDSVLFVPVFTSSRVSSVKIKQPGIYAIDVAITWETSFAATHNIIISDGWESDTNFPAPRGISSISDKEFGASMIRNYAPINETPSGSDYAEIQVKASQDSGSNKNVAGFGNYLSIYKIGELPF